MSTETKQENNNKTETQQTQSTPSTTTSTPSTTTSTPSTSTPSTTTPSTSTPAQSTQPTQSKAQKKKEKAKAKAAAAAKVGVKVTKPATNTTNNNEQSAPATSGAASTAAPTSVSVPNTPAQPEDRISRYDKRVRKALLKTGLKQVDGISQIYLRIGKNSFLVESPEVYKNATSENYVFFGQPVDMQSFTQKILAEKLKEITQLSTDKKAQDATASTTTSSTAAAATTTAGTHGSTSLDNKQNVHSHETTNVTNNSNAVVIEEIDDSGIDQKDIEMIMTQGKVSKAEAIRAYRENKGDIVQAIMSATIN